MYKRFDLMILTACQHILCKEVKDSRSLYVHIYLFVQLFL